MLKRISKKEILTKLKAICEPIVSTLGPGGRNVGVHADFSVIYSETRDLAKEVLYREAMVTKDGVTVSRFMKHVQIGADNGLGDFVAKLVAEAAGKTMLAIGDGTTTVSLLVWKLYQYIVEQTEGQNINYHTLVRDLQYWVKILGTLLEPMKVSVKKADGSFDRDYLQGIATVSANNDTKLGLLVADAVASVGLTGTIRVVDSATSKEYFEREAGYTYPCGVFTDTQLHGKQEMVLTDCVGLIVNNKIDDVDSLKPVIEAWGRCCQVNEQIRIIKLRTGQDVPRLNMPLILFVSDIEGSAFTTLKLNEEGGTHPVYIVRMPYIGDEREAMLNDLKYVTGCHQVFSDMRGSSLSRFGAGMEEAYMEFGKMPKVVLFKDKVIITPSQDSQRCMDEIADTMELMPDKDGFIADRVSRLKCGLVNLYVAGKTPIEVGDRRELIDDAIKATLSAIRGGVLPGGGKAMVWMSNQLWTSPLPSRVEEVIAYKAIMQVLLAPLKQLMENCYYNEAQFEATKGMLLKSDLFGMGFNFLEGTYENFLDTCTLDPADMPIAALENAVSVVGQLLKMDWFINIEKKA